MYIFISLTLTMGHQHKGSNQGYSERIYVFQWLKMLWRVTTMKRDRPTFIAKPVLIVASQNLNYIQLSGREPRSWYCWRCWSRSYRHTRNAALLNALNGTGWEISYLECCDLSINIEVFVNSVWEPEHTTEADSE